MPPSRHLGGTSARDTRPAQVLQQLEAMRPTITAKAVAVLSASALALGAWTPGALARPWGHRQLCATVTCRTLAADSEVRVFRASNHHHYNEVLVEWLPARQITTGIASPGEPLRLLRLSGPLLAYVVQYPEGPALVYLLNAHHGQGDGSWTTADQLEPGSPGVTNLFLTRSGGVAWLAEGRFLIRPFAGESRPYPDRRAIFCGSPRTAEPVLRAEGPDVSASALPAAAATCPPDKPAE